MSIQETNKINYRLKAIRASIGYSQWMLSNFTSISQSRISLIEKGHVKPSQREKEKIIKALDVSLEDIFPTERSEK